MKAKAVLISIAAVTIIGASVVACLARLGVPSRIAYRYVDVDSPGVSVLERYEPALSLYRGESIPRIYQASIAGETVFIADVEDPTFMFVPALKVSVGPSETVSVQDLEPACAQQHRESGREILVWWGPCAAIGDPVGFVLRLEGAAETFQVRGVVRSGGSFTNWHKP